MTPTQKKRFEKSLSKKRDELRREIAERREGLAVDAEGDEMEHVRSMADRDLAVQSLDRSCADLRLVEKALEELKAKSFGVCGECGEPIPMKRLEAMPWSTLCVACQERQERGDAYALAS